MNHDAIISHVVGLLKFIYYFDISILKYIYKNKDVILIECGRYLQSDYFHGYKLLANSSQSNVDDRSISCER